MSERNNLPGSSKLPGRSSAGRSLKPGWVWVRFGDVVQLNTDRCADPKAEGLERYVGIEHIQPEDLRIRSWGLVAEGTTFTNYFKPGQVTIRRVFPTINGYHQPLFTEFAGSFFYKCGCFHR